MKHLALFSYNFKNILIMPRKKNYLNNKDLREQIVISLENDELTREAQKMLQLLAERTINKLSYVNEEDRKDCLQFALLDLLKYWRNYKPEFPNAFAYYTEIAKRGYAKGWNKIHPNKYKGTLSMDRINSKDSDTGNGGMFNI